MMEVGDENTWFTECLRKTEMPEKELYSYQLCEIQDKKKKKKSFPLYSLVLESLRLCKRIIQNGKRWDNF